jgi:hypothetical protein
MIAMTITTRLWACGLLFAKAVLPLLIACGAGASTGAAEEIEETSKEIIAAQIRSQGFSCDHPLSAERDSADAKPGEAGWILKCENATYRVRLIPDMAADVERID